MDDGFAIGIGIGVVAAAAVGLVVMWCDVTGTGWWVKGEHG